MPHCARAKSTRIIRAALAAAIPLALGACAGMDTRPDRPFRTADICVDSAVPSGWIRTNDWRGKGCGIEQSDVEAAKTARAPEGILLASTAIPPKAKAKPKVDISRGANAVSEGGPNNWMTITDLDRIRIGRSLTACAGLVPEGWVEKSRYWDKGRCGNPPKQGVKNVMLIERVK
ncbi:MAG TPA: hypothetical protein VG328_00585 [Stellaceae bacterium]|jgi:hypothetical protein|nr:hypothetical protein [Stellaceae bacterium]